MNQLWVAFLIAAALALGIFWWRGGKPRRVSIADLETVPLVPGEPLYPVRVSERWGYMNRGGKLVIRPQWDDAGAFEEGLAPVGHRETRTDGGVTQSVSHQGYIDEHGRIVIAERFQDASAFVKGLARVKVGDRFGFIDRTGREVVPIVYEDAADFSEGLAAVKRDGKTGFVDEHGTIVIPCSYERAAWIASFKDGLACAFVADGNGGDRAGYIDRTGRLVIEPRYFFAQPFAEGLALVQRNGHPFQFIDRAGRSVIEVEAVNALSFAEGLAAVQVREPGGELAWKYLDREGKPVLSGLRYRFCGVFQEGLAGIQDEKGRGWGFIDRSGRVVIAPEWTGISLFKQGLARMEIGSLFRGLGIVYLDRQGQVVWREPG